MWFLDDGNIVGDLASIRLAMAHLRPRFAKRGCIVDASKSLGPRHPRHTVLAWISDILRYLRLVGG